MRLLLALAAAAVLATSCDGRKAGTVDVATPPAGDRARPATVAPVYPDERRVVFAACERAARGYFGTVDEQDAAAGWLKVRDHNGWYGDSQVDIRLSDAGGGGTRVNVEVTRLAVEWLQDREHQVLDRYLARLETEIRTVRSLRDSLAADQAPTVAGSPTGVAASSGTSRP